VSVFKLHAGERATALASAPAAPAANTPTVVRPEFQRAPAPKRNVLPAPARTGTDDEDDWQTF
jgi:hypothetical protein